MSWAESEAPHVLQNVLYTKIDLDLVASGSWPDAPLTNYKKCDLYS